MERWINMDKLKEAEKNLAKAMEDGNLRDAMYWRGIIDGLRVRNTDRYVLYDLHKAMKEE